MYLSELGLYHYRARVYNPHIGRFLQTDPIGYEDQINLYAYVGNDPMNATDPSGMEACEQTGDKQWTCSPQREDSKKSDADIYLEGDAARQAVSGATSSTMGDSSGWNPRSLTSEGNSPELSKSEGIFVLLGMTPPGKGLAAARGATSVANLANKVNHIFRPGKNLDRLVRASGGSAENAYIAVQQAANQALRNGQIAAGANGVLPGAGADAVLNVNGVNVQLIGGRVIDGVVHIGSFVGL